jgi:hypothetical protein
MEKIFNSETWSNLLERFSSYGGSVSGFCQENNISKSQFYYYKKRFSKSDKSTFHAIVINKEESSAKAEVSAEKAPEYIRIEIAKANIYIPAAETAALRAILKELATLC